jgi:hypothetical protein
MAVFADIAQKNVLKTKKLANREALFGGLTQLCESVLRDVINFTLS